MFEAKLLTLPMYRTEVRIFMCADAQVHLHVKLLLKLFILHEI